MNRMSLGKDTTPAFDTVPAIEVLAAVKALETDVVKRFRGYGKKLARLCLTGVFLLAFASALALDTREDSGMSSGIEREAKADSAQALEKIAPKSAAELAASVFYFGTPARLNIDIAGEAGIPAEELRISYKFTGDLPVERPYSTPFESELIPGYSRTLDLRIVRAKSDATGDKRQEEVLWERRFETRQTPPVFETANASVEILSPKGKSAKPSSGECSFAVKGVRVQFAKPIDAEQGKQVLALVNDLEVAEAAFDKEATRLQFFSAGDKPDDAFNSALASANISVSGFFDSGVYLFTVVVKNLPKSALKGKKLRGSLGIRLGVKLLNRRAMRSAEIEETLIIPVSLSF